MAVAAPSVPLDHLDFDSPQVEGTYLERLYAMLDQCSPTIASWTPNGTAFVVYDVEALEATVLPQFFKPIKFASFARHLGSYGFRKVKCVMDNSVLYGFRHATLVRGQIHEARAVQRRQRPRRPDPTPPQTDEEILQDVIGQVNQLRADMAATKSMLKTLLELNDLE
ncbi:hypothetical protein H310_06434 [Aphanomyces invadans]|uniref:HSF-type DNA-binding domain-containing protein n=1 Tax=Aphanomyces invadans TaxID=157072 RepID=A0A024U7L8_9STRA|nr:hypothetical protein H310_06434 [Aphanomyces invadans]ETW01872.1 hypothetical protein H310_06434 [Aphanomyces invadans]|eukprot:XP_008869720.1 hypothetical protein H310_06434 [Aphanomyces invadans]